MSEFRIDDPGKLDRAGQAEKQMATRVSEQGRTAASDVRAGAKAMSGAQWSGQLGAALDQGEAEWGRKLNHLRKALDRTGSNLMQTAKNFRDAEGDNSRRLRLQREQTDATWAEKQVTVLPDFD
ncbi:Proteins of 100 residues with WXG [Streptomyces sp. WMMB 714]|uniref:WXG100 family type VII secretion target n=1 Tax=Streptomyces sp. WMMB 714 TaxID=1286822 RepID=UPI0005F7D8A6|nr:WXG100 family type VII secretion target [Streptomyces sp. WMMB 714]SCK16157.1 Proteins of 100 residues with WXG [Streptomyces sp. WMMB 714]